MSAIIRSGQVLAAVIIAAACACSPSSAGSPEFLVIRDSVAGDALEIRGLLPSLTQQLANRPQTDSGWTRLLRVLVESPDSVGRSGNTPPVLGSYEVKNGRLRFTPQFAFAQGVDYRIELDLPGSMSLAPLIHRFTIPAVDVRQTTRVVALHPTEPILPSNVLRLTIEFSAPMAGGPVTEHVRVLDEAGRPLPAVFLQLNEELWDAERRSVTLLVDPGRIKRGLRSNLEMGAPFESGRSYQFVLDSTLRDARGAMLAAGYRRDIRFGDFDGVSPDPAEWRLSTLRAGTRDPLRVEFGEPLDRALALRLLRVIDGSGISLPGRASLEARDRAWSFVPASPWPEADVGLLVDAALEDLAGNSVQRSFDSDRLTGGLTPEAAAGTGNTRRLTIRIDRPMLSRP